MFDLLHQKLSSVIAISEEEFQQFCTSFKPKKLRKKQYLLQSGDVNRYQAFVVKGLLRSYTVDEKDMNIFSSSHRKVGGSLIFLVT